MTLMILSITLSLMFVSLNHPLSLGLILLMQTITISLISSFYTYSFWMSYILFLIMVGGMLILFTYVTSIASNEMFNLSNKMILTTFTSLMIIIFMSISDKSFFNNLIKINDSTLYISIINFINEDKITISKIYNKQSFVVTLMLINYLLLTLLIVVKITNINYGPIRQKF